MKRFFSGIQPTNKLTLGNYIGALRNWVNLQETEAEAIDSLYFIVDLHAITVPQDPEVLRRATLETAAAYLACGLDPQKNTLFIQSHVREHTELAWLLSCVTPMGWLSRMTQFKDKAGKNRDRVGLGLYAYPTLMAADILLYGATHVPVGEDQKQHIELTRDIALSINHHLQEDIFVIPEPVIKQQGARIMSLRDGSKKMSKSDPSDQSRIHLTDSNDEIALKIRKAKTDPDTLPATKENLENRPEAKNLLTIYAELSNQSLNETIHCFAGKPFSDLKKALTDCIIDTLSPIRARVEAYMNDQAHLKVLLEQGADKVRPIAEKTVRRYKDRLGLIV